MNNMQIAIPEGQEKMNVNGISFDLLIGCGRNNPNRRT